MTVSQVLYGEQVELLENSGDWQRIRNQRDGYEGYLPESTLHGVTLASTDMIAVRSSLLFAEPDVKSPVVSDLMYSSELSLTGEICGRFAATACGHHVWVDHCRSLAGRVGNGMVAAAASLFSGTPYLWGGRSPRGCDCSALVQLAAWHTGRRLPRDSGDQEASLAHIVAFESRQADDLVFWPGHVALLVDPDRVLHATAHSLQVCEESLVDVIARAGAPTSVKRLVDRETGPPRRTRS